MKSGGFGKPGQGFAKDGQGFAKAGAVDDPLAEVEYTDDLGEDCAREFTALEKGFAERAGKEKARFQNVTDSEYWFATCFRTREDKEKFLKALRVHKNVMGDKYLDGYQLAKILGVDMS